MVDHQGEVVVEYGVWLGDRDAGRDGHCSDGLADVIMLDHSRFLGLVD